MLNFISIHSQQHTHSTIEQRLCTELRKNRISVAYSVLLLFWLLYAPTTQANPTQSPSGQTRSSSTAFQLQQLRPNLEPYGLFQTHGAESLGQWGFLVGAAFHYSWNPLFLTTVGSQRQIDILSHQVGLDVSLGLGILPFLDIAVTLPMTVHQMGKLPQLDILGSASGRSLDGFFLSDIKVRARLQTLRQKVHQVNLAFQTTLGIPSGDKTTFNGEDSLSFSIEAMLSRYFKRFEFAVQLGYRYLPESHFLNLFVGHELLYSLGIGVDLVPQTFQVIAELYGTIGLSGSGDRNNSPMGVLAGVRIFPMRDRSLAFQLGVGTGILGGYGSSGFRGFLSVVWHPALGKRTRQSGTDQDQDGVLDFEDACPKQAGTRAHKGCPVADRDRDGVPDRIDRCPNAVGTAQNQGCPAQIDSDQDGIVDRLDACPKQAGSLQNRGCPSKTPPVARRNADTSVQDLSKRDRDGDGLRDAQDRCPGLPGSRRRRGCPRRVLIKMSARKRRIYLRRKVKFRTSTRMYRRTRSIFRQVARLMKSFSTMRIRIVATTYARSRRRWVKRRSYYQARTIRRYLIKQGISGKRISFSARRRYRKRRSPYTSIRIYILRF